MKRKRYGVLAMLLVLGLFPALITQAADTQQPVKASQIIRSSVLVIIAQCKTPPTSPVAPSLDSCEALGNGSGTIISTDGYVLTNAHVPFAGDLEPNAPLYWTVVALTPNARSAPQPAYFARTVLYNQKVDLALLQPAYTLDGKPIQKGQVSLPPLTMAKSTSNLDLEDNVRLVGYPGAGGSSVTVIASKIAGFVKDKDVPELGDSAWIKVDPAAGSGVSGGIAVDDAGELIGVPSAEFGNDIRCDDTNGDGKIDPVQECVATGGSVQLVRPIEGYELLVKKGTKVEVGQGTTPSQPGQTTEPSPSPSPQPQQPTADTVTLTGTIVSADTGNPIKEAYLLVLKPGVDFAKFANDQGAQEDVLTFGVSDATGRVQVKDPIKRQQPYTIVVLASGFKAVYQDNLSIPTNAPAVVDLGTVKLASNR